MGHRLMMSSSSGQFVVATPARTVCDDNARALAQRGVLRFLALGTRRGTAGVPAELTRLNPAIGAASYAAHRMFTGYRAESLRIRLHPWFDRWVRRQLTPGDHIVSSYGYVNDCFRFLRKHGGKTFLDAGNSHPENFWAIMTEEHRRWNWPGPPLPPHHYRRSLEMMPHVDYVLSPSSFVTRSFLERGFRPEQILRDVYPTDLSCFKPAAEPRAKKRPLTVISTGQLSLRKGTPYLLEAFQLIQRKHPSARLLLTDNIHESIRPVLAHYRDLTIDWAPGLPHPQLAERLRSADVFVLPSLEDGFARTVTEALACGLPVVLTPNTGAADVLAPGRSGEIVPIRDANATAEAILTCFERLLSTGRPPLADLESRLSYDTFAREFISQLESRSLV